MEIIAFVPKSTLKPQIYTKNQQGVYIVPVGTCLHSLYSECLYTRDGARTSWRRAFKKGACSNGNKGIHERKAGGPEEIAATQVLKATFNALNRQQKFH